MRALFSLVLLLALCASSAFGDFRERYREGMFAEALSELETSPEAAEKSYAYYLNRGLIHHALNQDPVAVAYLSKAKVIFPEGPEVSEPLAEATAGLVKWLGVTRLDSTSYLFETLGDYLPLDFLFSGFAALSLGCWIGFVIFPKKRGLLARSGGITLFFTVFFGVWSIWNERHPLVILTESRMVKSGPGESFFDRGAVEPGMKLRIVGEMLEAPGTDTNTPARRWWKIRFNNQHDLGFLPEQSGLLLTDESNTPNR